ncbi:T9SS type A sorting domain-containing protein [Fulvivirga lutea]|uniref:T9SS type A sorting domain-containing protein n=1 Tax=Fulvivirga lutea TaxID=2810512 RepID=A0A975A0T7_9BACT|nr:T9SS type A sorting domain-containing protein [Fulvivirga lutea]QSE96807.1 T9SS type A sorting domain-containing protein [Fulvivirga lutea]
MKIRSKFLVLFYVLSIACTYESIGQTFPSAHSLLTGDFVFSGFTNSASTAYPTSMRGYTLSSGFIDEGGDYTSSNMSNRSLRANSSSLTNFTIRNEGANGISIFDAHNASSANLGAIIVSLNTTGISDVVVSWTGRTIYSRSNRQFGIRIQYRVGNTGPFIDLSEEYSSTLSSTPAAPQQFNTVLPVGANDQTTVQVRWLYIGKVTGATLADRLAIDEISITGSTASGITLNECGTTISAGNVDMSFTELQGAERYEVELSGGNLGVDTYSNFPSTGKYNLNWPFYYQNAPLEYNQSYSVRIRPVDAGLNPVGDWGAPCSITTPAEIPAPQLQPQFCGSTLGSIKDAVQSEYVPFATNYRYELSGGNIVGTVTKETGVKNMTVIFSSLPDFTHGETYNVRVQAFVNGVWGEYGSVCQLTTDNTPAPLQIRPISCGATLTNWTDLIQADRGGPATQQWQFQVFRNKSGGGVTIVETILKSTNTFRLSELAAYSNLFLQENTNYFVRVRGYYNGIAGAYGDLCTITTPSSAPENSGSIIELFSWQCGTTISNSTAIYSTIPDVNYDGIEFRFRTSGDLTPVESIVSADNKIRLSELTLLSPNTTYSVDVRTVIQTGVLYGNYSSICNITTEAVAASRNTTNENLTSREFTSEDKNFNTSDWSVEVQNKESLMLDIDDFVNEENRNVINIYPNPFTDVINVEYNRELTSVQILDFNGREMDIDKTVVNNRLILNTANLSSGYYFIRTFNGEGVKTTRLLKE